MTTNDSGSAGPPAPLSGSAGFSHEWVTYRAGEYIQCPGFGRFDRRSAPRGERRQAPRPCAYTFGRVQVGTEARTRLVNSGERIDAPPSCVSQRCPACKVTVLLSLTVAAKAA